jgi:3-oxoacyl-[acyl-carrier protein] reductase
VVAGAARGLGAATAQRLGVDGSAVAVVDVEEAARRATTDAITKARPGAARRRTPAT